MEIVLKAPVDELIKKLCQRGFCDARGRPLHKAPWTLLDEDQIVRLFSSVNRGIQNYYRPTDNWAELSKIQYILKFSLAKTLASKKRSKMTGIIKNKDITVQVTRKGQQRTVTFYRNTDWTIDRKAFTNSPTVDLVRMHERMRVRSKLGRPCCICLATVGVAMHHVRHIRKMTERQARGFTALLAKLNRKQVPVCRECHRKIHDGTYDGLKLSDLAYDPS
jgi:hypothetical protein